MLNLSKRGKQWFAGGLVIILSILVWLVYFYIPLTNNKNALSDEAKIYADQITMLKQRVKSLESKETKFRSTDGALEKFSNLLVYGKNIDDINVETQRLFQNFFEKNQIYMTSYKVRPPGKWRTYETGRIEFNIQTSMAGISSILEFVENLNKVVRVENIVINFSRKKVNPLIVNLQVETLFVDLGLTRDLE